MAAPALGSDASLSVANARLAGILARRNKALTEILDTCRVFRMSGLTLPVVRSIERLAREGLEL